MRKENVCQTSLVLTLFAIASIFIMVMLMTLLFGCTSVVVPDTEVCAVSGLMSAGADCSHTLAKPPQTRSMDLDEWINFLEPQKEVRDPVHGSLIRAQHGAALCQSSEDWNKQKTALEQACKLLGSKCTYEIKRGAGLDKQEKNQPGPEKR